MVLVPGGFNALRNVGACLTKHLMTGSKGNSDLHSFTFLTSQALNCLRPFSLIATRSVGKKCEVFFPSS